MATKFNQGNQRNGICVPNFHRIDLLALYITMSLKRIVNEKLGWKEELEELYMEVEYGLKSYENVSTSYENESTQHLLYSIKEFSRVYADQWSITKGVETGRRLYETLMVVLCLRLGAQKLWLPKSSQFSDEILVDGFLARKPKLKLKVLNQADPFYEILIPLCENLNHIILPMCDNSKFLNAIKIKSLRMLEFTTGVSEKVLCQALWNADKKSEKLLQTVLKSETYSQTVALPDLEILKSNILRKDCMNSMKISFGAVALVLQKKLRIIENERNWTTFDAIAHLIEKEQFFSVKHKKILPAVKQLRIEPSFPLVPEIEAQTVDHLQKAVEMCPSINHLIFTHRPINLREALAPFYMSVPRDRLENLSIDISFMNSVKEFVQILSPFKKLKSLTLRIAFQFLTKFSLKNDELSADTICPDPELYPIDLPELKSLSLIMCADHYQDLSKDGQKKFSNSIISFLCRFSTIEDLHFYSATTLDATYVVYGCIGGSMSADLKQLKSLSIVGSNIHFLSFDNEIKKDLKLSCIFPELLNETTFNHLSKLKVFTLDEFFLSPGVDRFLEALRTVNVFVRIIYRPTHLKNKKVEESRFFKTYFDLKFQKTEITSKCSIQECFVDTMGIDLEETLSFYI